MGLVVVRPIRTRQSASLRGETAAVEFDQTKPLRDSDRIEHCHRPATTLSQGECLHVGRAEVAPPCTKIHDDKNTQCYI